MISRNVFHTRRYLRAEPCGFSHVFPPSPVSAKYCLTLMLLPNPKNLRRGLNKEITAKGKEWFGTAVTVRKDKAERHLRDDITQFGSITPENAMKWDLTEPTRNHFEWEAADAVVDVAVANGQEIHCHNLVWHSRLPCWVLNGKWDNATLVDIMTNHVKTVAGKYKGKCTRWDVVYEGL